jgi:hypothetical protein
MNGGILRRGLCWWEDRWPAATGEGVGREEEAPLGVPAAESGDVRRTRLMVGFGLSSGRPKMRRSSKDLYV